MSEVTLCNDPKPHAYCPVCGKPFFHDQGKINDQEGHECKPWTVGALTGPKPEYLMMLIGALVAAESVIDGKSGKNRDRDIARVKRALWRCQLTDDERLCHSFPTTAELPAAEW